MIATGIFIRTIVLTACLGIVSWQCIQILQKYLQKPQGTKIYISKVSDEIQNHPAFTFCKSLLDETIYNSTVLNNCSIEKLEYMKGKYASNESGICQNPKELYKNIIPSLESMIRFVKVYTFDNVQRFLYTNETNYWRSIDLYRYGRCYTFIPDKKIISAGVADFTFRLNDVVRVFVHDRNIFSTVFQNFDYFNEAGKNTETKFLADLQIFKNLNSEERPCLDSQLYDFDDCNQKNLDMVLKSEVGCTTPFGISKDKICENQTMGSEARMYMDRFLKKGLYKNNTCLEPCTFITVNLNEAASTSNQLTKAKKLKIIMKQTAQVFESYYQYDGLSFIAETGGYIGLFTGISFYNLADVFDLIMVYLKSKIKSKIKPRTKLSKRRPT